MGAAVSAAAQEAMPDLDQRVDALISAQARRTPDAVAVIGGGRSLSYAELERSSDRVAAGLRAQGVGRGALVGIHLDRSVDMLLAVIAVMKAGGAYVPLDPEFPPDRLRHMIADSGLAFVISEPSLAAVAPEGAYRRLEIAELLAGDARMPTEAAAPGEPAGGGDLAYVLYTSGSTGLPKGVAIEHRNVVNFLASMCEEPGIAAGERLLAVTTLSFDIAGLELYLPLIAGATVVIAEREEAIDGEALRRLLDEHRIDLMQATPSSWRLLIEAGWPGTAGFRALCGGEALPLDLAAALAARCEAVWNLYGPTETTIWSSLFRVPEDGSRALIGRPIANTRIYVLDKAGLPVPTGIPGEICIASAGVARGYLNRPELTAEKFVPDPFAQSPDERMYRTGDQGRYLADGNLEYRSRLDGQIKIRGYRIELGEIEHTLMAFPGLKRAVVSAREDRPGDVRLVAYVVAEAGAIERDALLAHLRSRLPHYMVPQHVEPIDEIPLLPNGKVDRKALPPPSAQPFAASADGARATVADPRLDEPRVAYLAGVWSELLGTEAGADDNFFDLGGHSMLAVQMANRVARETGVRLKLLALATQSLAQAAAMLPAAPEAEGAARQGPGRTSGLRGYLERLLGRGSHDRDAV